MTRWSVYKADGQYVGECKGKVPEVAFCECMVGLGESIDACDVKAIPLPDDSYQISFAGADYILRPTPH